jgi:hypothetical protein
MRSVSLDTRRSDTAIRTCNPPDRAGRSLHGILTELTLVQWLRPTATDRPRTCMSFSRRPVVSTCGHAAIETPCLFLPSSLAGL